MPKKLKLKHAKRKPALAVPEEPEYSKPRLEDLIIFLYGPAKVGKSTFCSEMQNPIFIETEPGL